MNIIYTQFGLTPHGLYGKLTYNAKIFVTFGIIHTLLAQDFVKKFICRLLPPQIYKTIYVLISSSSLLMVVYFWQNTGKNLWNYTIVNETLTQVIQYSVFSIIMGFILFKQWKQDALDYYGIRDLYRTVDDMEKEKSIVKTFETTKLYGVVRHPMYLLTIVGFLCTPVMSLDRFYLTVVFTLYLMYAIPFEENHMIKEFGAKYLEYKEEVPALFPIKFGNSIKSVERLKESPKGK